MKKFLLLNCLFLSLLSLVLLINCNDAECQDPRSCNNGDEGVCEYMSCRGCTDITACNYDPDATINNYSCNYTVCGGCTDPSAINYDSEASNDNGSCRYAQGCTDTDACNYDSNAIQDDGSCDFSSCKGCTNTDACNYDPNAMEDNGSCDFSSCKGCTDTMARNYNSYATQDDGSCDYRCTKEVTVGSFMVTRVPAENVGISFEVYVEDELRIRTQSKEFSGEDGVWFRQNDYEYNKEGSLNIIRFDSQDLTMKIKLYVDGNEAASTDHNTCYIEATYYISGNVVPIFYKVGGSNYNAGIEFSEVVL